MALHPSLQAELEKQGLRTVIAVEIAVSPAIRLFDGSGIVTIGGEIYQGVDDLFGTLDGLDSIIEAISNRAPTVAVTLMIPDSNAMAVLLQPENQNSIVSVHFAAIDYATGTEIGVAELLWRGRLDTSRILPQENRQTVELMTVSAFDRLFAADEGARLNPVWHQKIWPNETGLDRQIAGLRKVHWGAEGGSQVGGGSKSTPLRGRHLPRASM